MMLKSARGTLKDCEGSISSYSCMIFRAGPLAEVLEPLVLGTRQRLQQQAAGLHYQHHHKYSSHKARLRTRQRKSADIGTDKAHLWACQVLHKQTKVLTNSVYLQNTLHLPYTLGIAPSQLLQSTSSFKTSWRTSAAPRHTM